MIDWGSGRLYIPNAVHTALLHSDWLEGHMQLGTVTVLSDTKELITDALVQKSSVTDANAEYVQRLRVPEDATNEQIQDALHKLFNSSPQGRDKQIGEIQGPQGQAVLWEQTPQGSILSMNEK